MAWMVVGPDERGYRELLRKRAVLHGIGTAEYEAQLERASVPRGTPDHLAAQVATLAELGVDRIYIEVLEPLADVDTERLELIARTIRSI